MARYHVNPTDGNVGECKAMTQCPFGNMETEHYNSKEEARAGFESSMAGKYFHSPHAQRLRDGEEFQLQSLNTMEVLWDEIGPSMEKWASELWAKTVILKNKHRSHHGLSEAWALRENLREMIEKNKYEKSKSARLQRESLKGVVDIIDRRLSLVDYELLHPNSENAQQKTLRTRAKPDLTPRANWLELDKEAEAAIVKNYRHVVSALRKNRYRAMAPELRQQALKIVADRYHVPVSQVKMVVQQSRSNG